jgi:hypothetical protein
MTCYFSIQLTSIPDSILFRFQVYINNLDCQVQPWSCSQSMLLVILQELNYLSSLWACFQTLAGMPTLCIFLSSAATSSSSSSLSPSSSVMALICWISFCHSPWLFWHLYTAHVMIYKPATACSLTTNQIGHGWGSIPAVEAQIFGT